MHILIAPDSLKGSLSATAACEAIAAGLAAGFPDATLTRLPLADGGEGTLETLLAIKAGGEARQATVTDALGRPVEAAYGWWPTERLAVIELPQAAGWTGIARDERDPWHTTTFGVGELLNHALKLQPVEVWFTLGGSATVDAGAGFLQAIGADLHDEADRPIARGAAGLQDLARVNLAAVRARLAGIRLVALCDVLVPLLGEAGAQQFMAQKGATPADIPRLHAGLERIGTLMAAHTGITCAERLGAGSAGGFGAGLAWLGAALRSGAEVVVNTPDVQRALAEADVIVTAEGRLDEQTATGKLLARLGAEASARKIPLIALCGQVALPFERVMALGITAAFALCAGPHAEEEAIARAAALLRERAAHVGGLLRGR